jgi:adenylate kinase family enzyme
LFVVAAGLVAVLDSRFPKICSGTDCGRADDTEEVILNRMKAYRHKTAPLLDYYTADVNTMDAVGSVDALSAHAPRALSK